MSKPRPPTAPTFRNRILGLRNVRADTLHPHPENWRRHPESQRTALTGLFGDFGIAAALIVREHDGGLQILDGHLRADIAKDAEVSVLVTDLNDDEARKFLATFDPLSAMAETDGRQLAALLEGVKSQDGMVMAILAGLAKQGAVAVRNHARGAPRTAMTSQVCPQCGHEWVALPAARRRAG